MLLREKSSGKEVEVLKLIQLFDLYNAEIEGRYQSTKEKYQTENFKKSNLEFTSGEPLPRCWLDPHYRDNEHHR
jgi:hypothetical protein